MLWLRRLYRPVAPLFRLLWRFTRGLTLGVRGLVVDGEGRVLLIQHTYIHGWHFPGGGVEHGETAEQALARELVEEAGIEVTGRARLVSAHSNEASHPRDHVLLYRVEAWTPCRPTARGEIHEIGWFSPDALPDGTTGSTRRRIAEALRGEPPDPMW